MLCLNQCFAGAFTKIYISPPSSGSLGYDQLLRPCWLIALWEEFSKCQWLGEKRDFSKMSERLMKNAAWGKSERFVLVNWKLLKWTLIVVLPKMWGVKSQKLLFKTCIYSLHVLPSWAHPGSCLSCGIFNSRHKCRKRECFKPSGWHMEWFESQTDFFLP